MPQRLDDKDLELTIVTTGRGRLGAIGNGTRHILTLGLLGLIFAGSMMLVIFAS